MIDTAYLYDARGNLVKRQEADGEVRSYAYSLRSLLSSSTISDTEGSASYTTAFSYNDAGLLSSTTSPSGRVDYYTHDEAGRTLKQGNYGLGFTSYSYDGNGNVLSKRDGRTAIDGTIRYSYTVDNLISSVTDAKGNTTTLAYDRWGQRLSSSDANGNARSYGYDELGRVVAETTPLGASIGYVYDAWGNVVSQSDARGSLFTRSYTPENHLAYETARSSDGAQVQTTSYSYDEGGDLKSSDNGVKIDYNLSGGVYQADPYGLTTAKTTSIGASTVAMAFAYDERQRITKESYADSSSVNYSYNKLDQLTSVTDGSGASIGTLGYDAYGRLQSLDLSSGIGKSFSYDAHDRLAGLTYSSGGSELASYALKYDLASNIVEKNSNTYSYDAVNQLVGSSESGWFQKKPEDISPEYTVADRDYTGSATLLFDSTKIDQTSEVKLDMASRSVGVDLGQEYGVNKIELHPKQASTRVRAKDISVYVSLDNGTSTSASSGYQKVSGWRLTNNSDGSMLITFAKIETARYVKVNTIWDDRDIDNATVDGYATFENRAIDLMKLWVLTTYQTRNYGYDGIGNIATLNKDGSSQSYDYYTNSSGKALNLLKHDADWYYDYDKAGNRILKAKAISSGSLGSMAPDTSKEYWVYSWDLYNRLSTATQSVDGATKTVSYTYDAENFRVERVDSEGATIYGYDRNAALAYEKNLATGLTRTITYVNGIIVGWTDTTSSGTSTKYYAVTDNLGSVTHITDSSGKILWESEYTPYGEVAGAQGTIDFDGMYTGQDIDAFTGLSYHWNRWRSEDGTRFVSEDPAQDGAIAYNPMQRRYLTTNLMAGDGDMLSGSSLQSAFGMSVQGVAKTVTVQPGMQENGYLTYSGPSGNSPVGNPESGLIQSSLNLYYYVHANPLGGTDAFGLMQREDGGGTNTTAESTYVSVSESSIYGPGDNSISVSETQHLSLNTAMSTVVDTASEAFEKAGEYGEKAVSRGTLAKELGNVTLLNGFVNIDKDSAIASAEVSIASGGNDIREGAKLLTIGKSAAIIGQATSLGKIGVALASGDAKEATQSAWSYNIGVPGAVMTAGIGGAIAGPVGALVGGMAGALYFGAKGESFGGAYYDLFNK